MLVEEQILMANRNLPITQIGLLAYGADLDDELLALVNHGKLRLGEGTIDDLFWELPRRESGRRLCE